MLDPDLYAEYEAWRAEKLVGTTDLSIHAFNAEMEAQALAWEGGVKRAVLARPLSNLDELLAENPYRKPGMRGELPVSETHRKRLIDTTRITDIEPRTEEVDDDEDPWEKP